MPGQTEAGQHVRRLLAVVVVRKRFSVMSLVTDHLDHWTILCRQAPDDCPLRQSREQSGGM